MSKDKSTPERLPAPAQDTSAPATETTTKAPPVVETPKAVIDGVMKMEKVRKGRKSPPANESMHDKLLRLAASRVTRACKVIQHIGNLAAYKPSEAEIERIMEALGESCASVQNRLNGIRRESITFSLR